MDNRQPTTNNGQFSCVIIGEGTLPLQWRRDCAEPPPRDLRGCLARCAAGALGGRARHPARHEPGELGALLGGRPFDYLFSIVNYQVLPGETLAAPRRWAINYHDAPLPRYAGSYATSWALMAGERTHGVTWHLMTEQLDAGDILVQYPIEIAADERADAQREMLRRGAALVRRARGRPCRWPRAPTAAESGRAHVLRAQSGARRYRLHLGLEPGRRCVGGARSRAALRPLP